MTCHLTIWCKTLQPERSLSHNPLFQVSFVIEPPIPALDSGWKLSQLNVDTGTAKFDLTLELDERPEGIIGRIEYNTDLFEDSTISRMIGHYQALLEGIVSNPQQRVAQLPLIGAAEQHLVLSEWNNTKADYPLDQCFAKVFEAQVERTPHAVAVVFEGQQLTYRELNTRANGWARHLVELGVEANTIVALLCSRNLDFLTAILAVFKAGGAYLPLNAHHPVERLRTCLEQSQVSLVLGTSQLSPMFYSALNSFDGTPPQLLQLEVLADSAQSESNLPVRCQPDDLAYIIYTSGSTGTPKGAMLEQRGMLNHLYAKVKDLQLSANDVVAQTAPVSFDISVWQFLVALLVGGRVEIVRDEMAADPAQLLAMVERQGISILEIVPSLLRMMLQDIELHGSGKPELSGLRWLLLTGEALPPQLCHQWLDYYPSIPMMNAYGPTECSDDVTHYAIYQPPQAEMLNLPIGRPVLNTQLYVLDPHLQPVPVGVPGELCVGGIGVGRGYLNQPELTQKVFIPNPFAQEAGSRLYKTGDKARYLSDGNIEFLGRIDDQVKIRGFRIELGEIEAVLGQHPDVREVVTISWEDQPGNQHLVAYVVSKGKSDAISSELRSFLKDKLPNYMIPSAIVSLEKIPLTPNGKVDRRALPAPDFQHSLTTSFVPPHTPTQEVIANLWAQVLGMEKVGIHNNFFELGGHSLLATQVISRLQTEFCVQLPLRRLFEFPTIAELSELIETFLWAAQDSAAPASITEAKREEGEI